MKITAKVIADSISPCGARLTTQVWEVPRPIQAEVNTHRMLTRSSGSSRAVPQKKMIRRIRDNPFVPRVWGINQPGMQASTTLEGAEAEAAAAEWLRIRDVMIGEAEKFQARFNLHKQIVNRLTEPWMMTSIIITATDWDNLWGLRCHPDAEPHFQEAAYAGREAIAKSIPRQLQAGEWHLPYVDGTDVVEIEAEDLFKVSMARCARVSYLNHEGKRDVHSDLALYAKLVGGDPKHAAPSEHIARALGWPQWFQQGIAMWDGFTVYDLRNRVVQARRERTGAVAPFSDLRVAGDPPSLDDLHDEACLGELQSGNFLGFQQYRKTLVNENIGGLMP